MFGICLHYESDHELEAITVCRTSNEPERNESGDEPLFKTLTQSTEPAHCPRDDLCEGVRHKVEKVHRWKSAQLTLAALLALIPSATLTSFPKLFSVIDGTWPTPAAVTTLPNWWQRHPLRRPRPGDPRLTLELQPHPRDRYVRRQQQGAGERIPRARGRRAASTPPRDDREKDRNDRDGAEEETHRNGSQRRSIPPCGSSSDLHLVCGAGPRRPGRLVPRPMERPKIRGMHFPGDATTGYAVGRVGTILKTSDGGTNWVDQTSGTTEDIRSVPFPWIRHRLRGGRCWDHPDEIDGGANWSHRPLERPKTCARCTFRSMRPQDTWWGLPGPS